MEPVRVEGNPFIKISKFNCRPLFSRYRICILLILQFFRVDINCDKWLMTMTEDSKIKLEHPPSLDDGIDFQTEQVLFLFIFYHCNYRNYGFLAVSLYKKVPYC